MKRYAFLFALSSLVFACEQPTQKELRTQQSPLVHGVRDVQQTRGMLDLSKRVGNIHKHSGSPVSMPDDSQSMYRDVSVGFMARATGSMDVTGVYVPGDGSCTVLANDSTTPVEGTGVLSSPSRLTTATHIIEYPAPSFQAKVTFNRDGVYVCDSATGKNPCNTYSHDESTDHFYKQEDDFLLRNRLTAMSMETWARSQTYRGRLRKDWQFVLDDYSNQPYVRINGNNVTIRDIAVLKALDKADGNLNEDSTMINWEENQTWFPTGSFALNKPGIFFDYIDYKEAYETYSNDPNNQFGYDGIVIDDAVIPRYYALSVQQWPLENSKWPGEDPDTGKDNEIQLVSYNAAYINQMVQPSQPNIPRPTFHQDVVGLDAQGMQGPIDTCYGGSYEINKLVTYDGLILTTADVGPGASGGSFLGPNAERSENAPAGNENTKYLTGKKIFGLGVYKGPFGKGVNYRPFADNNWDPPRHDYLVCDDYSVEKCAPPVPLTSSSSNWFETPASYATFNDIPNGLNWPKRDDSYTKPG